MWRRAAAASAASAAGCLCIVKASLLGGITWILPCDIPQSRCVAQRLRTAGSAGRTRAEPERAWPAATGWRLLPFSAARQISKILPSNEHSDNNHKRLTSRWCSFDLIRKHIRKYFLWGGFSPSTFHYSHFSPSQLNSSTWVNTAVVWDNFALWAV